MSTEKGVTIAQTPGQTLVVENKVDGVKKYATFFGMLILAAIIQGVQQLWPTMTPWLHLILEGLQYMGVGAGTLALTSPFDKRGVVLQKNGAVEVKERVNITGPSAPSAPGGFGGTGLSLFICCLALTTFTGCRASVEAQQPPASVIPQSCPTVYRQPLPLAPMATASRVQPVANIATVGLKNPGAFPGENFSSTEGRSCQTRLTTDGWLTICPQPNDGDNFDARNQVQVQPPPLQPLGTRPPPPVMARPIAQATVRNAVVEREVTQAQPQVIVATPVRPAPVATDQDAARIELRAQFPGLLGA